MYLLRTFQINFIARDNSLRLRHRFFFFVSEPFLFHPSEYEHIGRALTGNVMVDKCFYKDSLQDLRPLTCLPLGVAFAL